MIEHDKQRGFSLPHILALLAIVAGVGGVGYWVYTNDKDNKSLSSQNADATVALIDEIPGNLLTVQKVESLAGEDKPGVRIASIKLEKNGEVLVYIVRLSDGAKLIYNAQSGTKIAGAKVDVDDDGEDLPANFSVAVDIAKAYETALAQNPGGKLKSVELDNENGKLVYKFQFSTGSEIKISASDSSVVKSEIKSEKAKSSRSGSNSGSSRAQKEDGDLDEDGVKNSVDSDDDGDDLADDVDGDDDGDEIDDPEDEDDDGDSVDDGDED